MAKKSDGLPLELIIEILLRLPVKTLLRCKCVCKSWLSLISDPKFATSHFQLAASPTTHGLVFLKTYSPNDPKALIVDFDASLTDDSSYAPLTHHFRPPRICPGTEIRGSCRGFIFLHTYSDFYLWNPSTGVHKKIPASKLRLYNHLYGFVYDHSTDDYLIVLLSCKAAPYTNLEIFSLRANKWKQIEVDSHFTYLITTTYDDVGLFLNDAIHWVVFNFEIREVIIAFDIKERKMSEIALPYDDGASNDDGPDNYGLSVLGGLICASIVGKRTVKIYVMQNYAVHSSWTKILEFSVDPVMLHSLSIRFITKSGDMIGTDGRGRLMKFNDKGQLLEHHSCGKGIDTERFIRSQMVVYTDSLLSLPCGAEEA
ncbi:F-box/kelch-repeat protein At3g23880-like [Vicia villosa]|uniref:F-box/kelch-repeat protein At3g23880-like n=1 Tax=Vicia villosa TaxID=3911 RepID=UPI00273B4EF4|nr:F-box/kelch-repeat protein At3g23880-like [Vicia villosa]